MKNRDVRRTSWSPFGPQDLEGVDHSLHSVKEALTALLAGEPEPKGQYMDDPLYELMRTDYYRAIELVRQAEGKLASARSAMGMLAAREEEAAE